MAIRTTSGYRELIDRVLDYVGSNLDGDLSLRKLSQVACFSPFHFHRLFHALAGETVNDHVRRARLERSAALLKASPRARLTDIALDVGFAGLAEFSRAFKQHFGLNASAWDRKSALPNSKLCKADAGMPAYAGEELGDWFKKEQLEVRVAALPACRFVYIRVHNPYGSSRLLEAYQGLMEWLSDHAVDRRDSIIAGMSQDDPAITPHEKCRYDIGAVFPVAGRGLWGEILGSRGGALRDCPRGLAGMSARQLPEVRVASVHCQGDLSRVGRVWQHLYQGWLPSSRYVPANLPAMEIFLALPEEIGWERFDLEACLPVERDR